ncbi:DUF748 domain-containing protein [Gynuella sunshinyii]|uniref:AsmA domain-containing protein n=1 Tax=Gynuella sunshinyii YC6258 TaxID=1445510 RepID=A0A0C5VPK9_9GAMM|nr:DUF748 domain-containing protein [Gynuella sunshinyii]AJQ96181.1 hypothetical Protein YC6258_04145 [Gynuella sunshinyii YC6258]
MTWLKRVTILFIALLMLICLSIWIFSPAISRATLNHLLEPSGIHLTEDSAIRLNPFRSIVSIRQLQLVKDQDTPLALQTLELRYSLFRLLFREVQVTRIYLEGLMVTGGYSGQQVSVAGFDFDTTGSETSSAADATPPPPENDENEGLLFLAPDIELKNITLSFAYLDQVNTVTIEQMNITQSRYQNSSGRSDISGRLLVNDASLTIDAKVDYRSEDTSVRLALDLTQMNLSTYQYLLPQQSDRVSGQLTLALEANIHQSAQALNLTDSKVVIGLNEFGYQNNDVDAAVQDLQLTLAQWQLEIPSDGEMTMTGQLQTALHGLLVRPAASDDILASLGSFEPEPAAIALTGNDIRYQTPAMMLSDIVFSSPQQDSEKPKNNALVDIQKLELAPFEFVSNVLTIGRVEIGASHFNVKLNDSGLANLVELNGPVAEQETVEAEEVLETEKTEAVPATESVPGVRIGEIKSSQPWQIEIEDGSQHPAFKKRFEVTRLSIANIDMQNTEQNIDYALELKDEGYFNLTVNGDVQPFGDEINANIEAHMAEFSLPDVRSYLAKALDFEFKAGQLDTDFSGTVRASKIDSVADVTIRGADFTASQNQPEETNVIGQTAVPLNVALGMLKDRHGDIHLKIPVEGDLEDPSFGVQHILGLVVKKAVMMQTRNYLINTFVPYAQVVKVSMTAGSYALKVRFEDLPYETAQVEVGEAQQLFVDQLSRLMTDKPGLRVKICPVVVPADIGAGASLTEQQTDQLLTLANNRAIAFKARLLESAEVESARLLLCTARTDVKAGSLSRLEFLSVN